MPTPIQGQDSARGILAVNLYAEGSHEWHAWGMGMDWASQYFVPGFRPAELVASAMGFEMSDFSAAERSEIVEAWNLGDATYRAGWRV